MLFVKDFLADQEVLRSVNAPTNPSVSVILPTYARLKSGLLERAVDSVLAQTMDDFEFIIMDDGSTDGTFDYIEALRQKDPRVVHVRHDQQSGLPGLRVNEGIELARGHYIAFQFDDDYWVPDALEKLVSAAEAAEYDTVVVGKSLVRHRGEEYILPNMPVEVYNFFQQNRIANNSVLLPRSLFERYGMYDPHIAFRRFCDWDLWLRLVKNVIFTQIDDIVSYVNAGTEGSLGVTLNSDEEAFRFMHHIDRNALLRPGIWQDYEIDALSINGIELKNEIAQRIYENQILPFCIRQRPAIPKLDQVQRHWVDRQRTALMTRNYFYAGADISFFNFDAAQIIPRAYKTYFRPETPAHPDWTSEADILILDRTLEAGALDMVESGLQQNHAMAYYLDDDLLNFHEMGHEFAYLAPGKPRHQNMTAQIRAVDAVWVTNDHIASTVLPYNRRQLRHLGSLRPEFLHESIPLRQDQGRLKLGYIGAPHRRTEFDILWKAFQQIAEEFSDQVTFEFWGLDISEFEPLAAPTKVIPFTTSYFEYLHRLRSADFDILLTPLFTSPTPKLGKSLIKYYETAAAGALGIFSDVPPYEPLPSGETCLKAENTVSDWYKVLRTAILMSPEDRTRMRNACIEHVRETYTSQAQRFRYQAALRATEFHALTRQKRHKDGQPRIAYVLHSPFVAGAEASLLRLVDIAAASGIHPILAIPARYENTPEGDAFKRVISEKGYGIAFVDFTTAITPAATEKLKKTELTAALTFLKDARPAIVHSVTFIAAFGQACIQLGVPHVAQLMAIPDELYAPLDKTTPYLHCDAVQSDSFKYSHMWGALLGVRSFCNRSAVGQEYFDLGRKKLTLEADVPENLPSVRVKLNGTIQPRKGQLEACVAVADVIRDGIDMSIDFYGYTHFYTDYLEMCKVQAHKDGIADRVVFRGFSDDIKEVLQSTDILLCASNAPDAESFPRSMKEAMAAGVLIVATPAGGIAELILDGVTGILCNGFTPEDIADGLRRAVALTSAQKLTILQKARQVAFSEFHQHPVTDSLFATYNYILKQNQSGEYSAHKAVRRRNTHGKNKLQALTDPSPVRVYKRTNIMVLPTKAHWTGIELLIGTHQRSVQGNATLTVRSECGIVLRNVIIDLDHLTDLSWLDVRFESIPDSKDKTFTVSVVLTNMRPASKISLFQSEDRPALKFLKPLERLGITVVTRRDILHRLVYGA